MRKKEFSRVSAQGNSNVNVDIQVNMGGSFDECTEHLGGPGPTHVYLRPKEWGREGDLSPSPTDPGGNQPCGRCCVLGRVAQGKEDFGDEFWRNVLEGDSV